MNNEEYLIVSYFAVGLASIGLGAGVYFWLRRPFAATTERLAARYLARNLRRLFSPGLILPALAGFLSVSYYNGCGHKPYNEIIADRAYLVVKNQQQVSESLSYLALAVLAWVFVITFALVLVRRQEANHSLSTAQSAKKL